MAGGYMGKLLVADLTSRKITQQETDPKLCAEFIGGSGLGAALLYEAYFGAGGGAGAGRGGGGAGVPDALAPESPLWFLTGPLCGTIAPTSGRHAVVARSPLTGIWGESDSGGGFGPALKKAGFDGVCIVGQAERPVYLWIHDGECEIRDAAKVWGRDTYETDAALRAETAQKAVVAAIGPAGERCVPMAAVMHDGRDARAAGRCGLGAVMGAKRLKAIVAAGSARVPVADPEALRGAVREVAKAMPDKNPGLGKNGTAGSIAGIEHVGDLPIRNWRDGSWEEGAASLSGQRMTDTILTDRYHCPTCPLGCGRIVRIGAGKYAGVDGAGPEYESLGTLGAMCLVDDLEAVTYASELCNRLGLDTISAGAAIAFAMEAYEKGLLSKKDAGCELLWGDAAAVIDMVGQIGRAEGLGKLLGQGVRRAAAELGGLAPEWAVHVKGLEAPAHDPRAYNSVGIGYATSNRGACHLQGFTHIPERGVIMSDFGYTAIADRFGVEGKGKYTALMQDAMCVFDAAKTCKFALTAGVQPSTVASWLRCVTGLPWDYDTMMLAGERMFNLKRLFNVRLGISRKDDVLPPRLQLHKRGSGGAAENLPPLEAMLPEYYQHRGWSEEGIPLRERLEQLGLGKWAGDLPGQPAK